MNGETFPDIETAPGTRKTFEATDEEIAEAIERAKGGTSTPSKRAT